MENIHGSISGRSVGIGAHLRNRQTEGECVGEGIQVM